MLQLNFIRENKDLLVDRLKVKNFDAKQLVEDIINFDDQRKLNQKQRDDLLARANVIAKEIGGLFKQGKGAEANVLKQESADIKQKTTDLSTELDKITEKLEESLLQLPNIPHPSVPKGKSDEDNEVLSEHGSKPEFSFKAVPHWELCDKFDIVDFDLGSKITGAGFPVYKGKGAKLQRSLIQFFLDNAEQAGYLEIQPPLMVNEASAYGTGQLPDKDGQMYHATEDNLYLIPTAEVPVTNIYRDVILKEAELPKKNVAYSACFRREAGSYGKDVRGLNRLHQFDKVEIVNIVKPEDSYKTLDSMVEYVSELLAKLNFPFRILRLCGGDLSFTSALTFDFEVYSSAQERWLEVSSISNFEAFQTNRMKCRYKNSDGKNVLAHSLNGSALALPRIMAALIENNQTEEGIVIPEALRKYTGFDIIK